MDCRDFEAWLDAAGPEAGRADADAHARACPDCAALLAADADLEAALGASLHAGPTDFTDRVMARVAKESRAKAALPIEPELLWPWWVQILREPQALLGLGLGAIYAAVGGHLVPTVRQGVAVLLAAAPGWTARLGAVEPSPVMIAACALPIVAGASWALYRLASAAAARLSGAAS
ncbi:MAG: hypothetical protein U0167_19245 [bacterium]